ncbi:unnamed protein product [Schistosoma curassoni]|uniref:TYR_PHOSPHATASE_2 domain-containing protein n=1 Tax=Schistosoma curassoni TaxID=6186 RepID=A0A183KDP0_9TREM|nr:unnamed protein product [Schistosoma curassoni]
MAQIYERMSIRSIFNMETAGEHSSCGFGLLSSGFSYNPLSFMKNNSRTGVIIACYLVFNNRISAGEAIQYVRFRRPGSIQTQNQVECVYKFEKYLNPYRIYFGSRLSTTNVTQSEAFTSCQPDETTELTSTTVDYSYGKNSPNQSVDDNQSVGASSVIEALLTTQYPESVVNETEYWKVCSFLFNLNKYFLNYIVISLVLL